MMQADMQDTRTTDRPTVNRLTRTWPTGEKKGDSREPGSGGRVPGAAYEEPHAGEGGGSPSTDRFGRPERGASSKGLGPLFVSERMGGAPGLPPLTIHHAADSMEVSTQLRRLIQLATFDLNRSEDCADCSGYGAERHSIGGRLQGAIDLDGQLTAVIDLRRPSDDPDIVAENHLRIAVCDLSGNITGVILGAGISRFRATGNHPDLPSALESALATGLAGGVTQVGERLLVALNHDQERSPACPALRAESEPR